MKGVECNDGISKVNEKITLAFSDSSQRIKNIIGESYLFKGKKVRPLLTILSYRYIKDSDEKDTELLYSMAAGIELIHCATLVHDDINDDNLLRRGAPTINSVHGNTLAQVIGDALFVKAFELCGQFDEKIISRTAKACSAIIDGEIIQHQNKDNIDISKETILQIAELKTGSLFGLGAYCGAYLADAESDERESLRQFGRNLGIAYQLVDDVLDYTQDTDMIGKNSFQDIGDGKITIPLFFALNDPSTNNKKTIYENLKTHATEERNRKLGALFERTNALKKTDDLIHEYCTKARKSLSKIGDTDLEKLVHDLSKRQF
jgi:octaprenyl-diphosphate synthase